MHFHLQQLESSHKVGQEIDRIKTTIRGITESRQTYGIENISIATNENLRERRRPSPHSNEPDIVGLEEDVKRLEARLTEGCDMRRCVISIVGMGGLGKTTLAKRVYNSSAVTTCFQCCTWVYVSQVYNTKELLQDIWKNVMGFAGDPLTVEQMKERLADFLKERRYLVVVDDVWTTQLWESIEAAFPITTNGSRILLTTRNKDVAAHADSKSPPHEPQLLSHENSWSLFLKKVGIEENDCPPNLEEIGKQIVKRCGGLPLAIVVLGGLLSRKASSYSVWSRLLDRVSWQLKDQTTQFSEILSLSYNDLPHYLKPCFIYFGVFPEDYEICLRRLIGLWIAEGLVQQRENETPEDVAEDYIEELIHRSMIQVAAKRSDGKVKTCRMHDLIRDLSLSKAKEANFLHINQSSDSTSTTDQVKIRRHASHYNVNNLPSSIERLRSLLIFNSRIGGINGDIVTEFVDRSTQKTGFRLLRVLDLEGVFRPRLPEALGDLIHLRYLGLRRTTSGNLPSSLGNLRNLQTLDLKSSKIWASESAIWPLQQLRHLYLNGETGSKIANPSASGNGGHLNLRSLQTLWSIYIDRESCVKDGLDNSTNLKKLKIYGDLASQGESLVNWLVKMDRLEVLFLSPSSGEEYPYKLPRFTSFSNNKHLYRLHIHGRFAEKLLDLHEFPPNLTMLTLDWCKLEKDPMPTLERLQNLKTLTLLCNSYVGKEMVCSSGGFLRLQDLKLTRLDELERWTVEAGAMRSLRTLELRECKLLEMIPKGLQQITTLQELKLSRMPETFTTRVQNKEGEDWHKIEHIPVVGISEW